MPLTLDQLNAASLPEALQMLDGLYEHSPWIAERALAQRPFASLAQLKHAMTRVLDEAGIEPQLALIRAHRAKAQQPDHDHAQHHHDQQAKSQPQPGTNFPVAHLHLSSLFYKTIQRRCGCTGHILIRFPDVFAALAWGCVR